MTAEERARAALSRWGESGYYIVDLDATVIAALREHEAEVRADEREACAKVAERDAEFFPEEDNASIRVATAIRARRP